MGLFTGVPVQYCLSSRMLGQVYGASHHRNPTRKVPFLLIQTGTLSTVSWPSIRSGARRLSLWELLSGVVPKCRTLYQ